MGLRRHILWKRRRTPAHALDPSPRGSACLGTWQGRPLHLALHLGTAAAPGQEQAICVICCPTCPATCSSCFPCRLSQCTTLHFAATHPLL